MINFDHSDDAGATTPRLSRDVIEHGLFARQAGSSGQLLTVIKVPREVLRGRDAAKDEERAAVSFKFLGRLRTAGPFAHPPLYRLERQKRSPA